MIIINLNFLLYNVTDHQSLPLLSFQFQMFTNYVTLDGIDWTCNVCGIVIEELPEDIDTDLKQMTCYECSDAYDVFNADHHMSPYQRYCGYCDIRCRYNKRPYSLDTRSNKKLIYHRSCHKKAKEIENVLEVCLDIMKLKSTFSSLDEYEKMVSPMKSKLKSLFELRDRNKNTIKILDSNLSSYQFSIEELHKKLSIVDFNYSFALQQIEIAKAKKKKNLINADKCLDMAEEEFHICATTLYYLQKKIKVDQEKRDFIKNQFDACYDDDDDVAE